MSSFGKLWRMSLVFWFRFQVREENVYNTHHDYDERILCTNVWYIIKVFRGQTTLSPKASCSRCDNFFTARQRSCRKVMFSNVRVCLSMRRRPLWPLPMMHWPSLYRDPPPLWTLDLMGHPSFKHIWELIGRTTASDMWWPILEICSSCLLEDPPRGDIWWHIWSVQVDGTQPTGMLFCTFCFLLTLNINNIELMWRSQQNFRPVWTSANVFPVFYVTIELTNLSSSAKFYYSSVSVPRQQKSGVSKYSNMEFNLAETFFHY